MKFTTIEKKMLAATGAVIFIVALGVWNITTQVGGYVDSQGGGRAVVVDAGKTVLSIIEEIKEEKQQ